MTQLHLNLDTPAELNLGSRFLADLAAVRAEEISKWERMSADGVTFGLPDDPMAGEQQVEREVAPAEKPTKKRKAVEAAPAEAVTQPAPAPTETPVANEELTLEAVRAKLAAISQAGKRTEVGNLLKEFGVAKLTDLPKDKYSAVLEKAEAL